MSGGTHRRLCAIELSHGYVLDGLCSSFVLTPTEDTARRLAGHRMLLRRRAGAIDVLVEVHEQDGSEVPLIHIRPDTQLDFVLAPADADWIRYTDASAFTALERPTLRPGEEAGALELAEGAADAEALPRGALARVEITGLDDGWVAAPPTYTVALAAARARWIFYYLGEGVSASDAPSIVDSDPARADAPIEFAVEDATGEGDRVAADLAARFPDRPRFRLVSSEDLACADTPRRHLSLRRGDDVLVEELPNPSLTDQSTVLIGGQVHETLYRVLNS